MAFVLFTPTKSSPTTSSNTSSNPVHSGIVSPATRSRLDATAHRRQRSRSFDQPRQRGADRYTSRSHPESEPSRSRLKRLMDVVVSAAALLCLAPLLIGIAVAIKATSPGPVLFAQKRYGYRNRRVRIYKFRTMYTHLTDVSGVRQTTVGDPRITPIGRILRSTSLDELPQLINVLKGDMSLVGPRPHVPGMLAAGVLYEDLVPYYRVRHAIRPGITGLAQVNGCRGSTTDASAAIARIDYDLEYIETWSLWFDIKIILRTIRQEFLFGSGI
jgi:exopolysaccharide biosynthesis polyprenyl glycosylphosphotransferase